MHGVSEQRKIIILYCIGVVELIAMSAQVMNKKNIGTFLKDVLFLTTFFSTVFIACDIVLRLCLVFFRLGLNAQSNTNLQSELKNMFGFKTTTIIIIIVILMLFTVLSLLEHGKPWNYLKDFNALACIPYISFSWILLRISSFYESSLPNSFSISSMNGLDYGTGMAFSYYYGYLRVILPATGTGNKGLLEKLENIEDIHNITINPKRLMILIPMSSYIPPNLKEVSYQWMENAITLEPEERSRAGIKKRMYHNNIYKIYPGGLNSGLKPQYVAVEGASALLTFFEAQKHYHPESNMYKKYHRDIVKSFYEKLKELLEDDPECRDLCELIYYDDYDNNTGKVNVAKLILKRVSDISTAS